MDEHSRFVSTRWTLVLQAGAGSSQARAALGELCDIYYAPVVSFIRHWRGCDEDAAREQAHGFFEAVLSSFQKMRAREGRELGALLEGHLDEIALPSNTRLFLPRL